MQLLFGFYDHGNRGFPGWALRNYIAFVSLRWKIEKVHFFCYREKRGRPDIQQSLVGEASFPAPHGNFVHLRKKNKGRGDPIKITSNFGSF